MQFEEIYNEYAPKVFRICLGYTNDYDKAQDLTQDTFIAVWENLKNFRGDASMATWVLKIAANKCLRALDNERRHQNIISQLPLTNTETSDTKTEEAKHDILRQCIAELPETDRLITGMYLEDIPQEKIAEVLGISHANVRVKVYRIKQSLTEKIKRYAKL